MVPWVLLSAGEEAVWFTGVKIVMSVRIQGRSKTLAWQGVAGGVGGAWIDVEVAAGFAWMFLWCLRGLVSAGVAFAVKRGRSSDNQTEVRSNKCMLVDVLLVVIRSYVASCSVNRGLKLLENGRDRGWWWWMEWNVERGRRGVCKVKSNP